MKDITTKESVIDGYGKLAKSQSGGLMSKLFACCNLNGTQIKVAEKNGYTQEEIDLAPEASNLGVGCGNPNALTKINEGETVVDLGSGAGFDAFITAKHVGDRGKVIGIDLSDDMLKLAKKNAAKGRYANVEFLKGDIEDLPLESNITDHVISNCVINLSLNKDKVYQEAYRILKPGGRLSISDIVLDKALPAFVRDSLVGHLACVAGAEKLDTYLGYVKDAGFVDVKVESKTGFPLEIMMTDPQIIKIANAMNFNMNSEQTKDIASRVSSISLTARKP